MNSRKILLLCAALFLVLYSGCALIAARKAKDAFLGTRGTVQPITVADKDPAGYPYVVLEKFTSDLKGDVVRDFLTEIRNNLVKQINEDEELNKKAYMAGTAVPGSPALRIEAELLDCDEGSKLGRATTFGGQAYIVMRYTVTDVNSHEKLAVFNARGFIEGNIGMGGETKDVIPILNYNVIRYLNGELHEMMNEE